MPVNRIRWFVAAGLTVIVALILLITGVVSPRASAPVAAALRENAREAVVSVSGLICPICANALEAQLRKIPSVEQVTVDLNKQVARLRLGPNGDVTDEQIREVVRSAGFNVTTIAWRGEPETPSQSGTTAEFTIHGMECALCAANLARVLQEEPGVLSAAVDFEQKRAVVTYDTDKTSPEELKKTIDDFGVFRAELVSPGTPTDRQ